MSHSSRREFLSMAAPLVLAGAADKIEVGTFRADVTPPVGEPISNGLTKPVATVEHPLEARGIILRNASGVFAMCAVDWGGLSNGSHDLFRKKIAAAIGGTPERVAVQCVHQHTAPGTDMDAERVLRACDAVPRIQSAEFEQAAVERVAAAAARGAGEMRPLTSAGMGWAVVDRVASSRRIVQPDGKIAARLSSTRDVKLRQLPEGRIDAYLRTLSLSSGGRPVAHVHYYATHPQSSWGDGRVTWDVPGIARERLEKETGVFQVYFTGCGGDIAMGKYNDASREARTELAERLYDGMARSVRSLSEIAAGPLEWKTAPVRFRMRGGTEFSEEVNARIVRDVSRSAGDRIKAAMLVAFGQLMRAGRTHEISCLHLGDVRVVHLPGEPFVEYQLWTQQRRPGPATFVAGYGDCAPWYVCTDRAYTDQGGYEQTWSFVDPCEGLLKEKIASVL